MFKINSKKILLFSMVLCFFSLQACGQSADALAGRWEGSLAAGMNTLPLVFHIQGNADSGYVATMNSPNQGQNGIPCGPIDTKGDSLTIDIMGIAQFRGQQTESTHIAGIFSQNGHDFQLNLEKKTAIDTASIAPVKRPQTPKPPFPYVSKDVIFQNTDQSLTYGATLTMPDSIGKFPAVLLITGSGAQNRDEEIMGHKPFAVLADYLTRAGYMVMRVDDRGVGESTGDRSTATTLDFKQDALTSLDYLENLPQVDKKKVGLLGHSEGGLIAEMIAAERPEVNFVILMAAPGIPITRLMELQRMAMSGNLSKEVRAYDSTRFNLFEKAILSNDDTTAIRAKMMSSLKKLQQTAPSFIPKSSDARNAMAVQVVNVYYKLMVRDRWMNNFLHMDPQPYLRKISGRVLAVNGSKDIQVVPKENLAGIKKSLRESNSKKFDVIELPGLNHLFQECKTCTVNEYGQLEQTLAPALLKTIGDWLKKNVPAHE